MRFSKMTCAIRYQEADYSFHRYCWYLLLHPACGKQMQLVYARTSHLVIWVGEVSRDSDLGMETLRQVGGELKGSSPWDVDLADVSLIEGLLS